MVYLMSLLMERRMSLSMLSIKSPLAVQHAHPLSSSTVSLMSCPLVRNHQV